MKHKKQGHLLFISILLITILCTSCMDQGSKTVPDLTSKDQRIAEQMLTPNANIIELAEPDTTGAMSLEETLAKRRSIRSFQDNLLTNSQIGQLLWAAQGITDPSGYRTAPSAGALYPLEIYAATQDGLFHYDPREHSLIRVMETDLRPDLSQAALGQDPVLEAPLVIIITAVYARTSQKYGEARTPRYVHLEAGHAAQNILLQAVALELAGVPIGAFHDDQIKAALSLPNDQTPLYLIPIGRPE